MKKLSDQVANEILSQITIDKKYCPGDKLPNEYELSESLGVSRNTVREAIRILVSEKILDIRRGKGTFVREDFREEYLNEMNDLHKIEVDVKDLYEVRLIFEPEAAYFASQRATDFELEHIEQLAKAIEELPLGENSAQAEQAFHRSIAKASHNEFMNQLIPILQKAFYGGASVTTTNATAREQAINDHRVIVDFLKKRNGEGARAAMKLHLLHTIEYFTK